MSLNQNSSRTFELLYIKPGLSSWNKLKNKNLETVDVNLNRSNLEQPSFSYQTTTYPNKLLTLIRYGNLNFENPGSSLRVFTVI